MGNGNDIFYAQQYTERTLIESILASFYIIDYGFVKKVNQDKTVDITHAKQLKTLDGESLPATITKNVEVLTLAGAGFSFKFDYKAGDRMLLLGLKNYVPKVDNVKGATETTQYIHYTRETLKAVPLCVFNDDAKVTVEIADGDASIKVTGKLKLKTNKDTDIEADNFKVKTKEKIELNGDDNGGVVIGPELKTQLGYLTARVDTIINALENSPTTAQDGGAAYKAAITTTLQTIAHKEDFSNIESDKVMHGKGGN